MLERSLPLRPSLGKVPWLLRVLLRVVASELSIIKFANV